MRRVAALAAVAALGAAAVAAPAASEPPTTTAKKRRAAKVEHMVVFRSGKARVREVRAKAARVKVGRKRCAVAAGTPLAALVRSKPGRVGLRDFGSCSRRARDGSGLFVKRIGRDRNKGQNGWVYKVGRKLGTAGAADPSGPFGRGRLRSKQRVVWFYCVHRSGSCQRTLTLKARVDSGAVTVTVRGYDNAGRGLPIEGATIRAGRASDVTGADGRATLNLPRGVFVIRAEKKGLVRSFGERVEVG